MALTVSSPTATTTTFPASVLTTHKTYKVKQGRRIQGKGSVLGPLRTSQPPKPLQDNKSLWARLRYHAYSIWLFTFSDIKTIIAPSLMFALFTAPALGVFDSPNAPNTQQILSKAPVVLFWVWINLLPFTIGNQRQLDAIEEDALNKPWRTMPSKRMTPSQARTVMLCLYPAAVATSFWVGGLEQCLSLIALGTWYNDFGGSDCSFVVRNLINAAGFNRFTTGALSVLLGSSQPQTPKSMVWNLVIAGIVFSTVQTQDMYDQLGDSQRNRRTVPLVIGDELARWSIAIPMAIWGIICPVIVGAPIVGHVLCGALACLVAGRSLTLTTVAADKATFKIWNLWLVSVYLLPLLTAIMK